MKIKIENFFSQNPHPNAPRIRILKSQEPRLAVVKGLVIDRRQKVTSGAATLKTRMFVCQVHTNVQDADKSRARASYGVLCRQLYDPNIHVGAEVVLDQYNKKQKWAIMMIDWLIKKVNGPTLIQK